MESKGTVLITQARTASTRLPGKVLLKINDAEILHIHLDRLQACKKIDRIIVATTSNRQDDIIVSMCKKWGVNVTRGSEENVLDRFYQTVKDIQPEWIVRVTSDCPLIDPILVDSVVSCAKTNDVDYCSNVLIENFPDGQDVEVFKFSALERAWKTAALKSEQEHVTLFIRNNCNFNSGSLFTSVNFPCAHNFSNVRMTVDEQEDFELMQRLIGDLGTDKTWLQYTNHIIKKKLNSLNKNIIRNEGLLRSLADD